MGFLFEHVVSGAAALPAAPSARGSAAPSQAGPSWKPGAGGGGCLRAPMQEEQKTCHLQGSAFSSYKSQVRILDVVKLK